MDEFQEEYYPDNQLETMLFSYMAKYMLDGIRERAVEVWNQTGVNTSAKSIIQPTDAIYDLCDLVRRSDDPLLKELLLVPYHYKSGGGNGN